MSEFSEEFRSRIIVYEDPYILEEIQKSIHYEGGEAIFSGSVARMFFLYMKELTLPLFNQQRLTRRLTRGETEQVFIEKHRLQLYITSFYGPVFFELVDSYKEVFKEHEQDLRDKGYEIIRYTRNE